MPFGDYATLQAAIVDWCEGEDVAPVVADLIVLAEAELDLRVRHPARGTHQEITTVAAQQDYGLSHRSVTTVRYFADGSLVKPQWRSMEAFWDSAIAYESGAPTLYTLHGQLIRFAPIPDAAYVLRLDGQAALPALAAAGTNWLLALAPHVYLYACLRQAAMYVLDDVATAKWDGFLTQSLTRLAADGAGRDLPPVGRSVAA